MLLPSGGNKILSTWAQEIVDRCRASSSARSSYARGIAQWTYTGSPDGNAAILNRMRLHLARVSSMTYSPGNLRFDIEFTHHYDKAMLDRADAASQALTREWKRRDIDIAFGHAVFTAFQYGGAVMKALSEQGGMSGNMVMPWQIGVYREDRNGFENQEAITETSYITPFDLWRRISHIDGADVLFKRAMAYAKRRSAGEANDNYFHQVLMAGTQPVVQTDPPFMQQPGGLVQVTADPQGAVMPAEVAQELLTFHEVWVRDDDRDDYTTIQIVDPDILIAPRFKRRNMYVPGYLPYTLVQPNYHAGYFFGRSELSDLMKLQHLLRDRLEDIKKLMSLQYDRLLAFKGTSGMTDELYGQSRQAGYFNMDAGGGVEDLTPEMPAQAFADIKQINEFIDEVTGFHNILSGQGEPGVRAGSHAQTLMRTASPHLRDRSLIVERQTADFGDKIYEGMAAKEAKAYWTEKNEEFLLGDLPDDKRVTVDSHSTSPIYMDDHRETVAFLAKSGVIEGESIIDLLEVPAKDLLKARLKELKEMKAAQMEKLAEHPELLKVIQGGKGKH